MRLRVIVFALVAVGAVHTLWPKLHLLEPETDAGDAVTARSPPDHTRPPPATREVTSPRPALVATSVPPAAPSRSPPPRRWSRVHTAPSTACTDLKTVPVATEPPLRYLVAQWASVPSPAGPAHWGIVEVGVNKAYVMAQLLTAVGVPGFTPDVAARSIFALGKQAEADGTIGNARLFSPAYQTRTFCGVDFSCAAPAVTPNRSGHAPVTFVGLEPNLVLASHAQSLCERHATKAPPLACHVIHAAASNATGTADFPQFFFEEAVGLDYKLSEVQKGQGIKRLSTPVYTLDDLLLPEGRPAGGGRPPKTGTPPPLDRVDVLLVDAEGFDDAVTRGAQRLFAEGRVALFVFEWTPRAVANGTLFQQISMLHDAGMSCYLAATTAPSLIPVVPACVANEPAMRDQGNFVCANFGIAPELEGIMEAVGRTAPPPTWVGLDRAAWEAKGLGRIADLDWLFGPPKKEGASSAATSTG